MVRAGELRNFRDLMAWQRAMNLAVLSYRLAANLPGGHRYELGRELRRSAVSVPSNIAEGFARHSRRSYRAHIGWALGSLAELETQIELGTRAGLLAPNAGADLIAEAGHVGRLLQALWRALADRQADGTIPSGA
jgi:four helix bundle protein